MHTVPKDSKRKSYQKLEPQRLIAALYVIVFGVLGAYFLVASHAATTLQPSVAWTSKNGKLVNSASSLCLTSPGTSKDVSGTQLVLEGCDSRTGEKWTLTWGSGTITNTTVKNGYSQCLNDKNGSSTPNNPAQVSGCSGNAASQTWQTGFRDGTIRIHGLCLGVSGNRTSAGAAIVILSCTVPPPPPPTINITSPRSGSTVSGTRATISANASVSSGSITSITLLANGASLKTCTNTGSCSVAWNTTRLKNGSYTVQASATTSGGASGKTSESVAVKNSTPTPTPQPKPKPGPTPQHPSSASNSGPTSTSNSSPTKKSTTSILSNPSNPSNSASTSPPSTTSPTNNNTSAAKASSSAAKPAVIITLLLLIVAGALIMFVRRRQAQKPIAEVGAGADLEPVLVQPTQMPVFPREDPAHASARLNWWQADGERQQSAQQASPHKADDDIPDMYAEGRKRLEEEEKRRHPEA